jgi:hypothetical protein
MKSAPHTLIIFKVQHGYATFPFLANLPNSPESMQEVYTLRPAASFSFHTAPKSGVFRARKGGGPRCFPPIPPTGPPEVSRARLRLLLAATRGRGGKQSPLGRLRGWSGPCAGMNAWQRNLTRLETDPGDGNLASSVLHTALKV